MSIRPSGIGLRVSSKGDDEVDNTKADPENPLHGLIKLRLSSRLSGAVQIYLAAPLVPSAIGLGPTPL